MTQIKLTFDQVDSVVIEQLQVTIEDLLKDPWSPHHDISKTCKDVQCFLRVLEYFLTPSLYKEYVQTLNFSKIEKIDL